MFRKSFILLAKIKSMEKVYFTNAIAEVTDPKKWFQPKQSMIYKLEKLVDESGILESICKGDVVAVKTHLGEHGTTKTLRSTFIRSVVEKVKERGGIPFVTETTGLGMKRDRNTAVGKLIIARENGYTTETVGAPIIIADGLLGIDGVLVTQKNARYLKNVYVAKAIAEADFVIVLTHFKLHMEAGIGGSIKNVGLGCVTKTTKFDIHSLNQKPPEIIKEKCGKCGACIKICPVDAIYDYYIDQNKCVKCSGCSEVCKEYRAIKVGPWVEGGPQFGERVVESAKAVIDFVGKKNMGFINFAIDITPHCDCHPYSSAPIAPDLGIFVSRDIVAVDRATYDAYLNAPNLDTGLVGGKYWNWTDPERIFTYSEEFGLGNSRYSIEELVSK